MADADILRYSDGRYGEALELAELAPPDFDDFLILISAFLKLRGNRAARHSYREDLRKTSISISAIGDMAEYGSGGSVYLLPYEAEIRGYLMRGHDAFAFYALYKECIAVPGLTAEQTTYLHHYGIKTEADEVVGSWQKMVCDVGLPRSIVPIPVTLPHQQAEAAQGAEILKGLFTDQAGLLTVGDCAVLYDRIVAMQ